MRHNYNLFAQAEVISSFIHSGYFYCDSSSPLLGQLRGQGRQSDLKSGGRGSGSNFKFSRQISEKSLFFRQFHKKLDSPGKNDTPTPRIDAYVRGAPDTARILSRSFTPKEHRQLRVKDLPKIRRLERDSNLRPFGRKAPNLPMRHHPHSSHRDLDITIIIIIIIISILLFLSS